MSVRVKDDFFEGKGRGGVEVEISILVTIRDTIETRLIFSTEKEVHLRPDYSFRIRPKVGG